MVQKGTFQKHLTLGVDKVEVRQGMESRKENGICHLLEVGFEADRNKLSELELHSFLQIQQRRG